ncbi:LacI family DNA-binding transcriptional regulator [Leucobacter sp. HY1910]
MRATSAGSRVTLKDVARASHVSPTTVSFVLNDTPGQVIPPETRDRVHAAAARLGYVPHRIARALREGSSRTVLLHTADAPTGHSLSSFIDGLDDELRNLGFTLLVTHRHSDRSVPNDIIEAFAPRAVLDLGEIYDAESRATSGVAIPDSWEGGWVDGMAAHCLTQLTYLAERGHEHIAFVSPKGSENSRFIAMRFRHAQLALQSLGLSEPVPVEIGPTSKAAAADLARLRSEHPGVTAIAAFNDDTALLALSALALAGVPVPQNLAVMGFDAGPHGALWTPSLTTLRINAKDYGRRAARRAVGEELGVLAPITPGSVVIARDSA